MEARRGSRRRRGEQKSKRKVMLRIKSADETLSEKRTKDPVAN